jgi:hypothetical protein
MQCGEARRKKAISMHVIGRPRQCSVFTKHRFSASMMREWNPARRLQGPQSGLSNGGVHGDEDD